MRERVSLTVEECLPAAEAILSLPAIAGGKPVSERVRLVLDTAIQEFRRLAKPQGIIAGISPEEFAEVYQGEGRNEPQTPLAQIYPGADFLALFAVTVGAPVSAAISSRFQAGRSDEGYLLDAVASVATEQAAERMVEHFAAGLLARTTARLGILSYSPGYCGWHLTGQRRLFKYLKPEEIGITLRESCLMEPLKSISGVIIAGNPKIHYFEDNYPCCAACSTHECRERIARLQAAESRN